MGLNGGAKKTVKKAKKTSKKMIGGSNNVIIYKLDGTEVKLDSFASGLYSDKWDNYAAILADVTKRLKMSDEDAAKIELLFKNPITDNFEPFDSEVFNKDAQVIEIKLAYTKEYINSKVVTAQRKIDRTSPDIEWMNRSKIVNPIVNPWEVLNAKHNMTNESLVKCRGDGYEESFIISDAVMVRDNVYIKGKSADGKATSLITAHACELIPKSMYSKVMSWFGK
jgi:hypothetical protein